MLWGRHSAKEIRWGPVSESSETLIQGFWLYLFESQSVYISHVSAHLISRGTDSFCSGLYFQGSEQPWKWAIVPAKQKAKLLVFNILKLVSLS